MVDQKRERAVSKRSRCEIVTIRRGSPHAAKERTGCYLTGVMGNRRQRNVRSDNAAFGTGRKRCGGIAKLQHELLLGLRADGVGRAWLHLQRPQRFRSDLGKEWRCTGTSVHKLTLWLIE